MSDGTDTWQFSYNADGLRTKRESDSHTYTYRYDGDQLRIMSVDNVHMSFVYNADGPMAISYSGTTYYYTKNLQGDITGIVDSNGNSVVEYTYDAWGNILSITGSLASTLGAHNPLRYRGYVYDEETKLYYLQSRYYNPETGRFLNADALASTGQGLLGNNMFAYCGNNPVISSDFNGESFSVVIGFNLNLFGWGIVFSLNFVSTKDNLGVQYSYYISDDTHSRKQNKQTTSGNSHSSKHNNQTVGVDVGTYAGIQVTEKNNMTELEGYSKTTGGDLLLGLDFLTDEQGEYLGWQFGGSAFSVNMHSIYTYTETIFSIPTINLPKIVVDWVLGED